MYFTSFSKIYPFLVLCDLVRRKKKLFKSIAVNASDRTFILTFATIATLRYQQGPLAQFWLANLFFLDSQTLHGEARMDSIRN